MAQRCEICGKGSIVGNKVSHANNRSKRRWYPNLQHIRALVDGKVKKIWVCTRCIKANKVVKAI
ncbi:MAG: 50S ribosomal protein L28 [Halobacteria archaeon]